VTPRQRDRAIRNCSWGVLTETSAVYRKNPDKNNERVVGQSIGIPYLIQQWHLIIAVNWVEPLGNPKKLGKSSRLPSPLPMDPRISRHLLAGICSSLLERVLDQKLPISSPGLGSVSKLREGKSPFPASALWDSFKFRLSE